MTTRFTHIPLSLLVVALTLFSCISDREVCTDSSTSDDKVQVKFTIAMDNTSASTRGTWDNDIKDNNGQAGTYYENTIEQGKLQVLVYNSSNKFICEVADVSYVRQSENDNLYDVIGDMEIPKSQLNANGTLDCKFVVLANYDTKPTTPTTNDEISSLDAEYTYDHDNIASGEKYIPMWGVKNVTGITLKAGSRTDIEEIKMLRAMAKVQVTLSADMVKNGYSISDIWLTDHNTKGYIVPNVTTDFYKNLANGQGTGELNADASFRAYASSPTSGDTSVKFWNATTSGTETQTYIVYVPEYRQGETPATIQVKLDDGKTYTIELKDYDTTTGDVKTGDDNPAKDLVRNTIYSYTITSIETDGTLGVVFAVAEWEHVFSQIGYDAQILNYADFEIEASGGNKEDATDGDIEAKYAFVALPSQETYGEEELVNKLSAARFQFKLTKPKGAVWYAYLTNEDDFSLSNGTVSSSQNLTSTGIARDEYYYIQVNPRHRWYQPTTLTYTDSNGNTQSSEEYAVVSENGKYVYINGKFVKYDSKNNDHKSLIRYNFDYGVGSDGKSTIKAGDHAYEHNWETATYGNSNESVISGPYTDLRIKISTDGIHFYDLQINRPDKETLGNNTYYTDDRRFAIGNGDGEDGGNYYIRIWQVKSISEANPADYAKRNTNNSTYKRN